MMIRQWKGDRAPKPVPPQRASAILSLCAVQEGWFYARELGEVRGAVAELGEMIWLAFQHQDVLAINREWSKIFCFKWLWRPKTMPEAERRRLVEIRKRGKTGRVVTEDELAFCTTMLDAYPEDYAEVDAEIVDWAIELMRGPR
jgi:hypothetical protein